MLALVRIRLQRSHLLVRALLPGSKCKQTSGGTSKPCVKAKGCDASPMVIRKELEVVQGTSPSGEPREYVDPAGLILIAVCKLNVGVREGIGGYCKLFEANDSC
jgi:hypothetical protein